MITPLGFGKCKLCVQAPAKQNVTDPSYFAGKRIVTSFPSITKSYFKQFETIERYIQIFLFIHLFI